jgi:geranylgeranyl diphosphate synthase type II
MYTLQEAQNLIEKHLKNIKLPSEPAELYEPVKYILSNGGKRVRPALALLACDLFSGAVESALFPATAIEIFHNFTLVHDDIMDHSEMRRGNETVHVKWNDNVAILSGDVMSILASRYINESPGAVLKKVNDVFTKTAMEVCEGQQMDMNFESRPAVEEEEYLRMIELKTAVLIAASLKIGAILGGASETDAEDLYQFGRNLGIAFQLQDDYLDTFGEEELIGKKVGLDIVDNKKTILMITALREANEQQRGELKGWLEATSFDRDKKIEAVKSIFGQLDIESKVVAKMNAYYDAALESLRQIHVDEDRKTELYRFAEFLMNRRK